MAVIKSLIAAISTYSKIPMPIQKGEESSFRFTIAFFPVVGLILYGLLYLWTFLCDRTRLDKIVFSIGVLVIMAALTGGIHIDGFMDVCDAKNSYGDREKKLEILKDPHIGAFCVIRLLEYIGVFFACLYLTDIKYMPLLFTGVIFSRIFSGFSVCKFKSAKEEGMIAYTKRTSSKSNFTILMVEFIFILGIFLCAFGFKVYIPVILSLIGLYIYKIRSQKEFGGITGDTSGYFLCMTELLFAIVFAVLTVIEKWI